MKMFHAALGFRQGGSVSNLWVGSKQIPTLAMRKQRAVLQRDLDPETMDKLFQNTADAQCEKKLLFSTVMMLMCDIVLKSSPSLHRACLMHREEVPVSIKAVYDQVNGLEPAISRALV